MQYLSVPKARVAVLIGADGETKKKIENSLKVSLTVEMDGRVTVSSPKSDALAELRARDIAIAIGRGFSPPRALRLLDEDQSFLVIELEDLLSNEKEIERQKSRIIGRGGACRGRIEETLGVLISVFGNTVALIGKPEEVEAAKEGILRLVSGSMHVTVFKLLERRRREMDGESAL